jgi:hypothetical protein
VADLRQYATIAEFAASPITSGVTTDQALVAASLDVDQMLLTAVYDTNEQGLPTDQDVVDALREATCAQAQYAAGLGDPASVGAGRILQASIGSISFTRSGTPSGQGAPSRYAPQAIQILGQAGLLGAGPWTW